MTIKNVLLSTLVFAAGCVSVPGAVSLRTSSYDGAKELVMQPGWASAGLTRGSLKFGAWKSSALAPEAAVLIVRNDMVEAFSSKTPNFFIKIDGQEFALSPTASTTELAVNTDSDVAHSSEEYPVDLSMLQRMVDSKDVKFKLYLSDGYIEGALDRPGPNTARKGLREFLEKASKAFPSNN